MLQLTKMYKVEVKMYARVCDILYVKKLQIFVNLFN